MPTPPQPSRPRGFDTNRWALMAQFTLFGVFMASWTSRLPSARTALHIDSLQLGGLLVVGGVGTLVGALTIGAVIAHFGVRTTLAAGSAGYFVAYGIMSVGLALGSVPITVVGLFANGLCGALVNVPINVGASAIERRIGRAVLPHFHAAWSVGAGLGALIGAGFAALGVHIAIHLALVGVVVTALRLWLLAPATPKDAAAQTQRTKRGLAAIRSALSVWLELRTLLLGIVLLAASFTEGSASTWLGIAVVDGFSATEATSALAYGTYVACMTVFRLGGTRLIDRFGRVTVLRGSGITAFVGISLFVFGPNLVVGWAGIVLLGFGAALGTPIAIAAASDDPGRAGERVSVVTSFSTMTMLTGPPLLGLLADALGARNALFTIAITIVLSLIFAGQARKLRPPDTGEIKVETSTDE